MATPTLLPAWLEILSQWTPAFGQTRSANRAVKQALGALLALGRRTLSRSLWALGRQHRDWSADYRLHSRAHWRAQDLFQPILKHGARWCDDSLLVVAMDDTRIRKTGRKILTAFYQRDPQSPKFRFNLMWGLRFLHVSLLVPLYRSNAEASPRSLPIRFLEVPAVKKPRKRASDEEIQAHRQAVKEHNLSRRSVATLEELRQSADAAGLASRTILAVGDASSTLPQPGVAAFTPPSSSLPIRCASGNPCRGSRLASSTAASGGMSAIKRSPRSTGAAAAVSDPCACWWWLLCPMTAASPARCRGNRLCRWPLTAPCCWPASRCSATRAPMPCLLYPNGAATRATPFLSRSGDPPAPGSGHLCWRIPAIQTEWTVRT